MRLYHYTGLFLILLFVGSCSLLDNFKNPIQNEGSKKKYIDRSVECPSYYISNYTRFLKNKKNEKLLKLYSVKLQCELEENIENGSSKKVIIKQTIYYQILKNNVKIDSSKAKTFIALVDEDKNKIKFKALSKINITPSIKVKDKVFFKNINNFRVNLDDINKSLVFYYGFQN
tara:strand:+ start:1382 stop:1900 length:519 start_codon:yes stop_codon:yes gene_type:complete